MELYRHLFDAKSSKAEVKTFADVGLTKGEAKRFHKIIMDYVESAMDFDPDAKKHDCIATRAFSRVPPEAVAKDGANPFTFYDLESYMKDKMPASFKYPQVLKDRLIRWLFFMVYADDLMDEINDTTTLCLQHKDVPKEGCLYDRLMACELGDLIATISLIVYESTK